MTLTATVEQLAALLDRVVPGWWQRGRLHVHPADVAAVVRTKDQGALTPLEQRACLKVRDSAEETADVIRLWSRAIARRREAGTPIATLEDPVTQAVRDVDAEKYAHVRIQHDDTSTDQAVWFYCNHCGVRRYVRATSRQDMQREAHDYSLRHRHCRPPKAAVH